MVRRGGAADDDAGLGADFFPGSQLGPYRLRAVVGVGGMARVWVAADEAGRIVAIKMLRSDLDDGRTLQQMFFDEARIASLAKHENICETYELAAHGPTLYLVMEWIDGAALVDILRWGRRAGGEGLDDALPLRHAARIVAHTCAGLHAAHELLDEHGRPLDVVHRDVSPHNVLLTANGKVKVTDFGVARARGQSHQTLTGQLKGKLSYMAPEQLTRGTVDRRTDVFGLGCLLYQLTTGRKPFDGSTEGQVIAATITGKYRRPSKVIEAYPDALERIVMRALEGAPAARFRTAEEMRYALEEYLRTTGPPIMDSHLAALLAERCGAAISSRARDLASPHVAPPRSRRARAPAKTASFPLAIGAGFVLGLVALGGIQVGRMAGRREHTERPATAQFLADAMADAAEPRSQLSAVVTLHMPPGASLVLDGIALPPGSDTIVRPAPGQRRTAIVRAEAFDDAVVVVEEGSPANIEVDLIPLVDAGAPRKKPMKARGAEDLPPNPYGLGSEHDR